MTKLLKIPGLQPMSAGTSLPLRDYQYNLNQIEATTGYDVLAHWPLSEANGRAQDASGHGHGLTVSGDVTRNTGLASGPGGKQMPLFGGGYFVADNADLLTGLETAIKANGITLAWAMKTNSTDTASIFGVGGSTGSLLICRVNAKSTTPADIAFTGTAGAQHHMHLAYRSGDGTVMRSISISTDAIDNAIHLHVVRLATHGAGTKWTVDGNEAAYDAAPPQNLTDTSTTAAFAAPWSIGAFNNLGTVSPQRLAGYLGGLAIISGLLTDQQISDLKQSLFAPTV